MRYELLNELNETLYCRIVRAAQGTGSVPIMFSVHHGAHRFASKAGEPAASVCVLISRFMTVDHNGASHVVVYRV